MQLLPRKCRKVNLCLVFFTCLRYTFSHSGWQKTVWRIKSAAKIVWTWLWIKEILHIGRPKIDNFFTTRLFFVIWINYVKLYYNNNNNNNNNNKEFEYRLYQNIKYCSQALLINHWNLMDSIGWTYKFLASFWRGLKFHFL